MADQELRDKGGRLLGEIKHRGDGKFGRLVGVYDPKADQTRHSGGALVGKGNLLASLITS